MPLVSYILKSFGLLNKVKIFPFHAMMAYTGSRDITAITVDPGSYPDHDSSTGN
jgi:hypothetical protein